MNKHRSFRATDISLRDIPGFLVAYVIISIISVLLGILVEQMSDFWRGTLVGAGGAMAVSYFLMRPRQKTDDSSAKDQ